MKLTDRIELGKRVTDSNGFVSVPAVISSVGIQKYHVDELRNDPCAPDLKGMTGLVNVFRGPDTVFHPMTMDSFQNMPATVLHPSAKGLPSMVNPETAKFIVGGHIGSDVRKIDERRLGCTLHLYNEDAIQVSVGSDTSAGYDCPVVSCEPGVFDGESYQFKFDGPMIGNHLALVPAGRCGDGCGVLDAEYNKETDEMNEAEVQAKIDASIGKVDFDAKIAAAVDGLKLDEKIGTAIAAQFQAKADAEAKAKEEKAKEEQQGKEDKAKFDARVALHGKLQSILGDDYDSSKADHDLMVLAVGETIENATAKSDEYLSDKVDEIFTARSDATPAPKSDAAGACTETISLSAY